MTEVDTSRLAVSNGIPQLLSMMGAVKKDKNVPNTPNETYTAIERNRRSSKT